MIDLTPIFQALVVLIASIITYKLIPYIKSKTTVKQQQEINAWVQIAVSAAEQIFSGDGRGPEKKKYVVDWLKSKGLTVDMETIDAMIEAAVYELNNGIITIQEG